MSMRSPAANGLEAGREDTPAVHFRQLVVGIVTTGIAFGAAGLEGRPADARGFCRFTRANDNLPPGIHGTAFLGNGKLAASAYGVVDATPRTLQADGSVSEKFMWFGAPTLPKLPLRVVGRRLDATAPPLRARVNEGGVDAGVPGTRFWASGLTFPTAGCWNVVGRVGKVRLSFVVKVRKPAS
jgi:hypothetical protein